MWFVSIYGREIKELTLIKTECFWNLVGVLVFLVAHEPKPS